MKLGHPWTMRERGTRSIVKQINTILLDFNGSSMLLLT